MKKKREITSFTISMVINISVLLILHFFIHLDAITIDELLAVDSITEEKKKPERPKIVTRPKTPVTNYTETPGATSATIGGRSQTVKAQIKIQPQKYTNIAQPNFTPSDINLPSADQLGLDLGESEVRGDRQVLVRGYGPALHLLARELIRMMKNDKLLVVWLFDESNSMKDDQKEIKEQLATVYQQLKIVDTQAEKIGIKKKVRRGTDKKKSLLSQIMLTSICSFGKFYHVETSYRNKPKPTSELKEIFDAIDRIPIDKTGAENMCAAVMQAINQHKRMAARAKRKLVLIIVSDESGDDGAGNTIDLVIRQAKMLKSPIYVLGRESVFGSLYAHVNWQQPETGRWFYLPIRRGPETPFAELLQYDGFRRRYDSHMSGFGPYEQVRLAAETGGIFFQLPHEQADLNDFDDIKYKSYALREYFPDLSTRSKYALERDRSPFRQAIWKVIGLLDPYNKNNKGLELPDPRYQSFSLQSAKTLPRLLRRGKQITNLIVVMQRAIQLLEKVRPLRAKERSVRWRANYDLISAQLKWYQLRLFEYGIGMDQFVRTGIPLRLLKNPKHNRFVIRENGRNLVLPDALNQKRFRISGEELKARQQMALKELAEVQKKHPETPWASRAVYEMKRAFGVTFTTYYQPPPV
ncbi:MAG: VWA domain-containing protein, partial [Planctomycetes bacterium]|nr:VWA domain-containing protein [Planctomycetota bacterium]